LADITIPDLIFSFDDNDEVEAETDGLYHPCSLAVQAGRWARDGATTKALLAWAVLVAVSRCVACGRRVYTPAAVRSGFGEHCRRQF
jgi:hypothetical protein